ncbi:MAG: hypothetical protein ABSC63_10340 [Candidatus Binataceae bacterium]|jgi:hypothetical protein
MKLRLILASVALACVGFGAPAFAQAPSAQADLQRYIANHPELQRNPSLLSDPAYLNSHPAYAGFLQTHPAIRAETQQMGGWDRNYQWRDADWWHRNDPDWVFEHHPEWNRAHPDWMMDGDYDDAHHWHNRNWWMQNHPDWAAQHHPHWGRRAEPLEHHGERDGHHTQHDHGQGNGHQHGHDKD